MKLTVSRDQLPEAPTLWLHHAGWGLIHDRRRGVDSFVKRLGAGFYPRLHLYVDESGETVTFNMHLDQKETSYSGQHMHNAEYDNELVGQEIESIKLALGLGTEPARNSNHPVSASATSINISKPQYNQKNFQADLAELKAAKPKSFWQRLLGL